MREIKFRVWNYGINAMFDVYGFNERQIQYRSENGRIGAFSWAKHNKKKFALMQFTGLTDNRGTQIYEGDIVFWSHLGKGSQGVVEWVQKECMFHVKSRHETIDSWIDKTCTILGNIYANPELS